MHFDYVSDQEVGIMYSLLTINQFQIGDFIVQLLFIFILLTLIVSIVSIIRKSRRNNERLKRIEEKVEELLSKKDT